VFWSQEYRSFDEIDLPNLTVTEANPAHRLAFRRFASDEVVRFNQIQVDILRALSPGRDITDRYPNPLIETVLARFMAEGRYAAHLRRARKRCRMARDALVEGLSGAPLYLTIPDQGLHLVAHARNDLSDADLQRLAQTGGLASRRLSDMFIQAPAQQGLVIGYSGFEADEVRTAALGAARSISCWRKRR
jgi:DNA-binding transcriptional MocR family regulator